VENIYGLSLEALTEKLTTLKVQKFRAKQIAEWLYQRGVSSFNEMTNLPVSLRQQLAECFSLEKAKLVTRWDSSDGKTSKFLLAFVDGVAVETVLMRQPYGNSVCVSTQAGCAMGCAFCASTVHGVERNLTAGEILSQVLYINDFLRQQEKHVTSIVIMGSGEPFMNYENVLSFIRLLHEPYTLNLSYRSMTISTSGIVPNIKRLAEENIPITLSISLHAPNDEIRSRLMPVNRKYPIQELVAAGSEYAVKTKRRVTYEYILIAGVNDSDESARELSRLLQGRLANVNLIPINPVVERNLNRPNVKRIEAFNALLGKMHITSTVRREMGVDIQAACGQLRNKQLEKEERQGC